MPHIDSAKCLSALMLMTSLLVAPESSRLWGQVEPSFQEPPIFAPPPERGLAEQIPGSGKSRLTPILPLPPRPKEEIESFIDSLHGSDATFQVMAGQGRLLALKKPLAEPGKEAPLIAVGDPSIVDFEVIGPRHLRIVGKQLGITDLSVLTSDNQQYSFLVQVVTDLDLLRGRLRQAFPDANLKLAHMREHVVVEGQARDARQVAQILEMIDAYLRSAQLSWTGAGILGPVPQTQLNLQIPDDPNEATPREEPVEPPPVQSAPLPRARTSQSRRITPEIINLIKVPGPQQVLLKVQVAELNRTALRQLDASFLFQNESTAIGSNIGGGLPVSQIAPGGPGGGGGLLGLLNPLASGATTTAFGIFDRGDVNFFINALRQNQVFKILAEPNLVAMHGQQATFLSGGEFPVPVPQPSGGGPTVVTVEFRRFGVQLGFVPYILDDDTIRLSVAPEVSSIDFATGVSILGTTVPGLSTRRTSTVVELKEGQTLAISGILQVTLDGTTVRIPGLGDLPYIGPLFSSNSTQTVEKELVILVTPHLVEAMDACQVPPLPGSDVEEPTDCEFYLRGRIERRDHLPFRATAAWDDPFGLDHRLEMERRELFGPYGYSN